jgi:hypothetical protein
MEVDRMALGLTMTGPCQPQPVRGDAVSVACGAVIANPGPEVRFVAAAALDPHGAVLEIRDWILPPGAHTEQLPDPPAGGVWIITSETQRELDLKADFWTAGAVVVGALAGLGLADLVVAAIRAVGGRRA